MFSYILNIIKDSITEKWDVIIILSLNTIYVLQHIKYYFLIKLYYDILIFSKKVKKC